MRFAQVLCLFFMLSATASADAIRIYPIADTWVNESNPDAAYGLGNYLSLKDRSGAARVFLKFSAADLASLSGKTVESLSLRLYQYQATYSPGDDVRVRAVESAWDEDALTWHTMPQVSSTVSSALSLTNGNACWREFTGLESLFAAWVAGNNYGVCLESDLDMMDEELFARFYSSSAVSEFRPYLLASTATAAPEPVASVMFGLGGLLLALVKKRVREG